jgi:FkbM family methyltransferase
MRTRLIRHFLRKRGLTIAPLDGPNFEAAMLRLKARLNAVETLIDVGASNGCWTEACLRHYSEARVLCIEAQAAHEPSLKRLRRNHANVEYALAAAGDREGTIYFEGGDLFGGVASERPVGPQSHRVPMTTIDSQVRRRGLAGPFLIKLDTHGFELPILSGAAKTLGMTTALVIEVYNFQIAPTAVRFPQLCQFMEGKGFRCVDLFDPMYRPKDRVFWQMDMVFMRADRPEFKSNSFG